MSEMGLAEYCHDINHMNAERLIEQFQNVEKNAEKLKPVIRQKVEQSRKALDEQYSLIFNSTMSENVNERSIRYHALAQPPLTDLKRRSVRGGFATVLAQSAKFVIQTATMMVLARLLSPQDFGLQGMVVVVTGFLALFQDAGLGMATIQRLEVTHEQTSTLFWINVASWGNTGHTLRGVGPAPGRVFPRAPLILDLGGLGGDVCVQRAVGPARRVASAGYAIRDAGKDRRVFSRGLLCDGNRHGFARLPLLVPSGHGPRWFHR